MYKYFFKYVLDFLIASIGFLILLPIFISLTILLFLANEGKPFFLQVRPGKNAKLFKIIKFKTMNDKRTKTGELLPDADRITRIGKFVRNTSLDEVPQLLNVIIGDMSLIGPRPLLPQYLPLYNKHQNRRHLAKPGITGWAQVNGRNTISWEQKFDLDIWYVDHLSFFIDIKIIAMTIKKVFKKEGITANNMATTEAFKGNSYGI